MFNDDNVNKTIIPVPKAAVGVVIGKGGDMINQIQDITGTRVQFKPGEFIVKLSNLFRRCVHCVLKNEQFYKYLGMCD